MIGGEYSNIKTEKHLSSRSKPTNIVGWLSKFRGGDATPEI